MSGSFYKKCIVEVTVKVLKGVKQLTILLVIDKGLKRLKGLAGDLEKFPKQQKVGEITSKSARLNGR